MKRRVLLLAAAGLIAVLVGGGLFASNMGFKLTYVLDAGNSNNSASGRNSLALPYIPMSTLTDVNDLCNDIKSIGGAASVASISSLDPSTNKQQTYNCVSTAGYFVLTPGEGYEIGVVNDITGWVPDHY